MPELNAPALPSLPPDSDPESDLLQALLEISLSAVCLLRPVYGPGGELADFDLEYVNPAGQRMIKLAERPHTTLLGSFPETASTGILDFYRRVYETGQPGRYDINYQFDGLDNFFQLAARRTGKQLVVSLSDTAHQDRSAVEQALRESQARERQARAEADQQRQRLQSILMEAPALISILEGPDHVFRLANPPTQHLVGDRPLLGKPLAEVLPELAGQPVFEQFTRVYRTGKSFQALEMPILLNPDHAGSGMGQHYYNFNFQATRNLQGEIDGILVFAYLVTAQVLARQQMEQSRLQVQALNQELEARVQERTRELEQARAEAELQRRRLEGLFMEAPGAICILGGADLVYELVNPAYQQFFPGRQLLGLPLLEALPEIADNAAYRTFRQVYETGRSHQEEALLIPFIHPQSGELEDRYFKFIQQARRNAAGQVDGVLVFAFEVTGQVRARQASEASAHQLRLITDALPVLIGYLDKDQRYRFANQAYTQWFKRPAESLMGLSPLELAGEKAYRNVEPYIKRALAGERLEFEAFMPYRENFKRYTRTTFVPDIREGEVAGFYIMVTDITEQVEARQALEESEQQAQALARELAQANEELRLANQQLTRINVDLDNFIYTASHDLKTPILNIEGLMEALTDQLSKEGIRSPDVQRITYLALDSVHRFKRTIDHLTDITKLQKAHSPEASAINLAALLADVLLDLGPAIQASQGLVKVGFSAVHTISFSEKNLRSILYNLLSNSLKYQAPGRPPRIQVGYAETNGYQVVSVQDNGLGMDLSRDHKLFTMFTRLHDHVEGSGIGLYMVKKIIENAGGRIEVESRLGEGSLFKVYFPKETSPEALGANIPPHPRPLS